MLTTVQRRARTARAPGDGVRHQAAIAGTVADATTGAPIAAALVEAMPPARRPDMAPLWLTRTGPDGHFHFLDLPSGKYSVRAALPEATTRYGGAEATVDVTRDRDGTIALAATALTLAATTVNGQVTRDGKPVGLATVVVLGSGERAVTDAQGRYTVAAVQTGRRTLEARAPECEPVRAGVVLERPGDVAALDFSVGRTTSRK